MKKKLNAFTLVELVVVLTVLAFLSVITISTINTDSIKENKIVAQSRTAYNQIETLYIQILSAHTTNGNGSGLIIPSGKTASTVMMEHLKKYLDGADTVACSSLTSTNATIAAYLKNTSMVCAKFPQDMVLGINYNTACNLSVLTKEYVDPEVSSRTIGNNCGYIVYGFNDGKSTTGGELGKDIFTIALGKYAVRK